MNAKNGTLIFDESNFRATLKTLRDCKLAFAFLPLMLVACASTPTELASDCEPYGVMETHTPMGKVVRLEPLYRDELNVRCAGVEFNNAAMGTEVSGCSIPHENGVVEAYYWAGDNCAMTHELCHFKHGANHTKRYLHDLETGVPMPYCPPNPFTLVGR